jgi:hypothetical protein
LQRTLCIWQPAMLTHSWCADCVPHLLPQATSLTHKQPNYLGRNDPPDSRNIISSSSSKVPLQGVLELGGGSLQVTFLPSSPPPPAEASPLALPSLGTGRLYSRSFDGLGLQVGGACVVGEGEAALGMCCCVGSGGSSSSSSSLEDARRQDVYACTLTAGPTHSPLLPLSGCNGQVGVRPGSSAAVTRPLPA